ncbi:hypothetical protein HDU76_002363, partial [Blyttiomyces sp. JEL0837]
MSKEGGVRLSLKSIQRSTITSTNYKNTSKTADTEARSGGPKILELDDDEYRCEVDAQAAAYCAISGITSKFGTVPMITGGLSKEGKVNTICMAQAVFTP